MLLAELRAAGFSVSCSASTLFVEPASGLTGDQRSRIRSHKHEILRELHAEATEHRAAISEAANAAKLEEFRASLILGRSQLCGNCSGFTFAPSPADLGQCSRLRVEAWPFVPFRCVGFKATATPAARLFLPTPSGESALQREFA
jgi:hypothetical protein